MVEALIYGVLVYSMIGFEWTVAKFLWYLFFTSGASSQDILSSGLEFSPAAGEKQHLGGGAAGLWSEEDQQVPVLWSCLVPTADSRRRRSRRSSSTLVPLTYGGGRNRFGPSSFSSRRHYSRRAIDSLRTSVAPRSTGVSLL